MPDLYATLKVRKNASPEAIKRAFRKRAAETHPDRCVGDDKAAERFAAVTHAYRVLSDPERRGRYDATGDDSDAPSDTKAALANTLTQVFRHVVIELAQAGRDPATADLVGLMKETLRKQAEQIAEQAEGGRANLERLRKLSGRFSTVAGEENVLEGVLEFEARALASALAGLSRAATLCAEALAHLSKCRFRADPVKKVDGGATLYGLKVFFTSV